MQHGFMPLERGDEACIRDAAERHGIRHAVLPGQRPGPLDEAIDWARAMLSEGWYVDYLVDPDQELILMKLWEFGDPEPS